MEKTTPRIRSKKSFMKLLFAAGIIILTSAAFLIIGKPGVSGHSPVVQKMKPAAAGQNEMLRLNAVAAAAKPFIRRKNYCERYCFLIDMHLSSGHKRFFVYDLLKDSIVQEGMVTHGSGSLTNTGTLSFSDVPGSYATSLGKYVIGAEYNGSFGLAFKLSGLDATNSHAYARAVVLHGHRLVPANETYPEEICTSWGCPTVNPGFLLVLKKYINDGGKPVLLWIFY